MRRTTASALLIVTCILSCILQGCDVEGDAGSGGSNTTPADSFSVLVDSYRPIVDAIPDHPRTQDVVETLCAAIAKERNLERDEAVETIIGLYPDENLG